MRAPCRTNPSPTATRTAAPGEYDQPLVDGGGGGWDWSGFGDDVKKVNLKYLRFRLHLSLSVIGQMIIWGLSPNCHLVDFCKYLLNGNLVTNSSQIIIWPITLKVKYQRNLSYSECRKNSQNHWQI